SLPPAIFRRLRRPWDLKLPRGQANAPVAELVDALDSKSSSARSAGSIPARGTTLRPLGYAWRSRAEHEERSVSGEASWRRRTGTDEDRLPQIPDSTFKQ